MGLIVAATAPTALMRQKSEPMVTAAGMYLRKGPRIYDVAGGESSAAGWYKSK